MKNQAGAVVGCKPCCRHCKTNDFVLLGDVTVSNASAIRFAFGNNHATLIVGRKIICCNPCCPEVVRKQDSVSIQLLKQYTRDIPRLGADFSTENSSSAYRKLTEMQKHGVTSNTSDPQFIELLPDRARAKLEGLLLFQKGGADTELFEKVIHPSASLSQMVTELRVPRQARTKAVLNRYLIFVQQQRAKEAASPPTDLFGRADTRAAAPVPRWPAWRHPNEKSSLLFPTHRNIRKIIMRAGDTFEPYLLGDLVRRAPGAFAASDGTYRLLIRTHSDGKLLLLIIGEDNTIVAYYVCMSESWDELYPALLFLRARLERLGVLDQLKYWWSDTCCGGASKAKVEARDHVLCRVFPSMQRCPFKDRFHGINSVTKTAHGEPRPQKEDLGRDLAGALQKLYEPDVHESATDIMGSHPSLSYDAASARARETRRRDGEIRSESVV